eukprot:9800329-Alexandrium_andersonii.AAC.1
MSTAGRPDSPRRRGRPRAATGAEGARKARVINCSGRRGGQGVPAGRCPRGARLARLPRRRGPGRSVQRCPHAPASPARAR